MRSISCAALLIALAVVSRSGPASAGPLDPVPVVNGQKLKVVYRVTGVIANNQLETAFVCTSLDSKDVLVAVEIFKYDGNLQNDVTAGNGVDVIEPGHTGGTVTNSIASIGEDEKITNLFVVLGSARILASSSKLLCSAHLVSAAGSPPSVMTALPVFRKGQKGD